MALTATVLDTYRRIRTNHPDYPARAQCALKVARAEEALQAAEDAGKIRFVWEYDDLGFDNPDWENAKYARTRKERHEFETWARRADRAWKEGWLQVEICRAEIPVQVTRDGIYTPLHEESQDWQTVASVGGVEIDLRDHNDTTYRREIERELAAEAGVIEY